MLNPQSRMKIYLLRHADALDGVPDETRPLSEKGRAQCARLVTALRVADIQFDLAYSSPLTRAVQTTERLLPGLMGRRNPGFDRVQALTNEASQDAFESWLNSLPAVEHLLLVGHNPSISAHLARMLGASVSSVSLSKASMACIQTEDRRRGRLRWLLNPKLLGE